MTTANCQFNFSDIRKIIILLTVFFVFETNLANAEDWKYEASPYLWAAGIDGSLSARDRKAEFDSSFSDIIGATNFAAMGRFEARKDKFFLTGDLNYLNLTQDSDKFDISADAEAVILELGAGYRVLELACGSKTPRFSLDLLGGGRYFDFQTKLEGPFGRDPEASMNYWEAFIGPRANFAFNDKWSIGVRSDFGGFNWGEAPEFTWQLTSGVRYDASKSYAFELGYKILDTKVQQRNVTLNEKMHGIIAGMTFKF